jgi:hypothetical protein
MPEPFILSPLQHPFAWVAFVLKWGGSILCVFFAFRLWHVRSGGWWALIGAGFLLSLVAYLVQCAMFGIVPLPQGDAYPDVPLSPSAEYSGGFSRMIRVEYEWDITAPFVAVALWWAYRSTTKPVTEPGAAPNGGPATRLGNSGAMEGPPSVS